MKNTENLCVIVMEECAELAKAVSKALRFGFNSPKDPDTENGNGNSILTEYYELNAVMEMLMETGILKPFPQDLIDFIKADKKTRVLHYTDLSKVIGTIEDAEDTENAQDTIDILTDYIINKIHSCPFDDDADIDFEKECAGFGETGCRECILRHLDQLDCREEEAL